VKMRKVIMRIFALLILLILILGYYVGCAILYAPQLLDCLLSDDITVTPRVELTLPVSSTFWIALGYDNTTTLPEVITGQLQVFDVDGLLLNDYAINVSGYGKTANWLSHNHGIEKCAVFRLEELDAYPREQKYVFKIHIDDNPHMSLWLCSTTCEYFKLRYRKNKGL